MEWHNLADNSDYAEVKARLKNRLPTTNADDVYVLKWPQEDRKFWESALKAAEPYHGKLDYPKSPSK
jgi:diketogulonate reductase-like aldo/keto reductase